MNPEFLYEICNFCEQSFNIVCQEFYLSQDRDYKYIVICEDCLVKMGWKSLLDFEEWDTIIRRKGNELPN